MQNSIPIYVINLKRNPERKLFIQRQLDAFGLDYQFVDAVDKYDLESPEYRTHIAHSLGINEANLEYKYSKLVHTKTNKAFRSEGLGRIACLLSHVKTHNLILENHHHVACVVEDDAVLLPTFPSLLADIKEPTWDILMLSSHSKTIRKALENMNGLYKRVVTIASYNYLVLARCREATDDIHQQMIKLLGFPTHLYPTQSQAVMKILEEFTHGYKKIIKRYNPKQHLFWLLTPKAPKKSAQVYKELIAYTAIQLGGVPYEHNRQLISDYHYIAEPAEKPASTMAYLVSQKGAEQWRAKAVAHNTLQIDGIPWPLHAETQVRLRLLTLPCVISSHAYAKYPVRQI